MEVCLNCGAGHPPEARFCMRCGSPLLSSKSSAREARKTVTVVFCDVSGFTNLADRLEPESLRNLMGRYFDDMREVLERFGGSVEKFAGDAIMAVFGVPAVHEDDALRAVRAVFEMKNVLGDLNEHLRGRWGVGLQFHAGLNTGEVVAGEGTGVHSFATGQPVNVAARLQQVARPGEILLGADTYRLVREVVDAELLPPLELRNHPTSVTAYRLRDVAREARRYSSQLDTPLIGRRDELARLAEDYRRAGAERVCRVVTVLGDAGIGKSRLMDEFLRTTARDALILSGRCLSYGGGIALWPVVEVIRQAAGIGEGDWTGGIDSKLLAVMGERQDSSLIMKRISGAMGITESVGMEQIFWGIRSFLEALAAERPVAVVFDDIHWGEPVFLDLIEYLAACSIDAPLYIVCLARPELLGPRPAWLAGRDNCKRLTLVPLSPNDSEMLIEGSLGSETVPDKARQWIVKTSAGNPLFVQEILKMMIDEGVLERSKERWSLHRDVTALAAPPTIQALLAARLDSLPREEKSVLQIAAVVGHVFWWGALVSLSEAENKARVGRHLQTLVTKEFVRPCDSPFLEEDAFRFGHILIRDAAYQAIPKETRAELHERFASWLEGKTEAGTGEYQEILGYHYEQAYLYRVDVALEDERSARLANLAASELIPAARRAHERGDVPGALNLFERAEALLPALEPTRLGILVELAAVLIDAGELGRADELLSESISASAGTGDVILQSYATLERLRLHIFTAPGGALDEAHSEVERAIEVLQEEADDSGLAKAWGLLGSIHSYRGRLDAAERAWRRALAYARAAGSETQAAQVLALLADTLDFGPTAVPEAIERCHEILASAKDDQKVTASTLVSLSALEAMRGQFEKAREDVGLGRRMYEELGLNILAANCSQNSGLIEMLAGDSAAAESEFRNGYELLAGMRETGYLSTVAAQLAHALLAQQRDEEAVPFIATSRTVAALDDVSAQALWRTAQAKLVSARADHHAAERLALQAVEITEPTDLLNYRADALMDLGTVLERAGRAEEAAARITAAMELYNRKGNSVSRSYAAERLGSPPGDATLTPTS